MIKVDLEKAKVIAKEKLRKNREPLLAALDVQFLRALEEGRDPSWIISEKNRLRAVTDLVNTAQTVEELDFIVRNSLS